jgi:hypothetical protein
MRRGLAGPVDPAVLDPVGLVDLAVLDLVGRVGLGLAVLLPAVPADIRDPVGLGRVDPVVLDPVVLGRVVLRLAVPRPVAIRDPVARAVPRRVGLAVPHLVGRVDLAVLRPVGLAVRADIRGRVVPVARVGPVDRADLVNPADLEDRADLANIRGRVVPVGLAARVGPVDRVGLVNPADLVDRASLVIQADRLRRRTRPAVLSSAVARRWAARGMCRTASAHPITAHLLRRRNADGVGMVGLRPERRRHSGTDRRLPVVGTVRHLPVAGTPRGLVRRVTWDMHSVISDPSATTGTTRSRCSIRYSVAGGSGSSDSGFRCTDTTENLTAFGPC